MRRVPLDSLERRLNLLQQKCNRLRDVKPGKVARSMENIHELLLVLVEVFFPLTFLFGLQKAGFYVAAVDFEGTVLHERALLKLQICIGCLWSVMAPLSAC